MTRRALCLTSTMICSSSPPSRTPTTIQSCSSECFRARTDRCGRRPWTGRSDTLEWAGPGVQSRVRQTRISPAQSGSSGSSASRTAQSTSTRRDWSPAVSLKYMESITSTHTHPSPKWPASVRLSPCVMIGTSSASTSMARILTGHSTKSLPNMRLRRSIQSYDFKSGVMISKGFPRT